jgi:pimeloyl-ACP methyl ester carboxylesterase
MTTEATANDRSVLLNGVRVHYREWGATDAPTLVILHGLSGSARLFDEHARALADGRHILVPDLRGHGETDWAPDYAMEGFVHDLERLAKQLQLPGFALLGQSLGGTVAYHYAARYPARVERLVLGDIGPDVFAHPAYAAVLAQLKASSLEAFDDPEEPVRRALAAPSPTGATDERTVRARTLANLVQGADGRWHWRYDVAGLAAKLPYGSDFETAAWAALARVRCPTLVVRGENSPVLSRENAERMVQTLADGRWIEVPASGHAVPFDNPAGFLAVVRPFLVGESP